MAYICGMHGGYMGMGVGWLIQLLIFVAFFLIVWWLLRNQKIGSSSPPAQKKPLDILKSRLAKGEITKKEYKELKKEIE